MSVFTSFCNFSAFLSHSFRILKRENGNVGGRESFFILVKAIKAEDLRLAEFIGMLSG